MAQSLQYTQSFILLKWKFKIASGFKFGCHDTQHNNILHNHTPYYDTQHNDTYNEHNDNEHNDNEHNDNEHNDNEHNDTQHIDTQHNDTQQNDTQQNNKKYDPQHYGYQSGLVLSIIYAVIYSECCVFIVRLSVTMLNAVMLSVMAPKI